MQHENLIEEYLKGNPNVYCSIEEIDKLTCSNCIFNKNINKNLKNDTMVCQNECKM